MKIEGWILIFVFVGLVALIARPMGLYLAAVFEGRRTWLSPVLAPLERGLLAFNTAVSFVTNTNWQAYGGETTMSHLTPDGWR
jgi:K+-transporting ATPase ATPase A chain